MTITRIEIASSLASWAPERLWEAFLGQVRTVQPFWEEATRTFAKRVQFASEKTERHLNAISGAFDRMAEWRSKPEKYMRVRRGEIDSAISFMRNRALDRAIAPLRVAPSARNAAGAIRVLLTTSCHGYHDRQMPELVAATLYNLAAVRTLFPFDFGTMLGINLCRSEPAELDPFVEMLKRAGGELGIHNEVTSLFTDVTWLWERFETPQDWELPTASWSEETDSANARVYFSAVKAFHR